MPLYTVVTQEHSRSAEIKSKIAEAITRIHASLRQRWSMFRNLTEIATEHLALSLQEIPSRDAMEMGEIMLAVGPE